MNSGVLICITLVIIGIHAFLYLLGSFSDLLTPAAMGHQATAEKNPNKQTTYPLYFPSLNVPQEAEI